MFISKKESAARLESEDNLVRVLRREDSSLVPTFQPLPPSFELQPPPDEPVVPAPPSPPAEREKQDNPKLNKDVARALSSDPVIADAAMERLLSPSSSSYKGSGPKHLTDDFRAAMAVTGDLLGNNYAKNLGGVSQITVWGHQHAQNSYQNVNGVSGRPKKEPREELREKIVQGHGIVVDKCFNRLLKTLDLLDDDKLQTVKKATELSIVAKNLSGIIAHASNATQDKYVDNKEQSVHFHIMRPEQGKDDDYPTIEISPESSPDRPKDGDFSP
jgi:hypothetical protein